MKTKNLFILRTTFFVVFIFLFFIFYSSPAYSANLENSNNNLIDSVNFNFQSFFINDLPSLFDPFRNFFNGSPDIFKGTDDTLDKIVENEQFSWGDFAAVIKAIIFLMLKLMLITLTVVVKILQMIIY